MSLNKTIIAIFAAVPALGMANVMNVEEGELIGEIADAGGACVSLVAEGSDEKLYYGFEEGETVNLDAVVAQSAAGGSDSCAAAMALVTGGPAVLGVPTIIGGILGLGTVALAVSGSDSGDAATIAPPPVTPSPTSPAE